MNNPEELSQEEKLRRTQEMLDNFLLKQAQNTAQGKTRRPYYNEATALVVKGYIDTVVATKQAIRVAADNCSIYAIKCRYYDGLKYLKEVMDPTNHYKIICSQIACSVRKDYIEIYPRRILTFDALPVAVATEWRKEMTQFIDSAPAQGAKYHTKTVVLSEEDIQWAHDQMKGIENLFIYRFERHEILIVRYSEES